MRRADPLAPWSTLSGRLLLPAARGGSPEKHLGKVEVPPRGKGAPPPSSAQASENEAKWTVHARRPEVQGRGPSRSAEEGVAPLKVLAGRDGAYETALGDRVLVTVRR